MPSASMLALVSRPPVKAPSASPARSKSLIVVAVLADDLADQAVAGVEPLAAGEVHEVLPRAGDRAEGPGAAVR